MNKQTIVDQLNNNRENGNVEEWKYFDIEILNFMQVAVKGSTYFHENVAVVYCEEQDKCYVVGYSGRFPPKGWILCGDKSINVKIVHKDSAMMLSHAIFFCKTHASADLSPYTQLVTYCMAMHNVDIRELLER